MAKLEWLDLNKIKDGLSEIMTRNRQYNRDLAFIFNYAGLEGRLSNCPDKAIKVKDLLEIMDIVNKEWKEH